MNMAKVLLLLLILLPSCTLTSYYPGLGEDYDNTQRSPYYYNYGYVPYRPAPTYLPPYSGGYAPYPYQDQDDYYSSPYSYNPYNRRTPAPAPRPYYPQDNDGSYYYNYPPVKGANEGLDYYTNDLAR